MSDALRLTKLSKHFGRPAVDGLDLSVRCGELYALLGPNGAGKTTSFYMIVGLVPSDAGQIDLDGAEISRLPIHRRAMLGLSYLPQEASVFRRLSVSDNIMAVLELRDGMSQKQREDELDSLLDELKITHIADQKGISLSGGERRRVEIARALATDPALLVLDEPAAGLNDRETADLAAFIRRLNAGGLTILLVEHDMGLVMSTCQRVMVLASGRKIADGPPAEIQANAAVREAYLGGVDA